ncbi:MAG: hypothetical protein SFU56_21745 [Capsulimonadales bacterium]|nr:hypothetical protein [Capsulimonadales bacterium]
MLQCRQLRKNESDYDEAFLTSGPLEMTVVPGFRLQVEWLFSEDRPDAFTITKQLLEGR